MSLRRFLPVVSVAFLLGIAPPPELASARNAAAPHAEVQERTWVNAVPTDDPRVYAITRPMKSEGLEVSLVPLEGDRERQSLARGKDYGYDPVLGRIFLLGERRVDDETHLMMVSGVLGTRGVFRLRGKVERGGVKVILGSRRLVEGEGFEVDPEEGVVRILDPEINRPDARYYISTGKFALGNHDDSELIKRLLLDEPPEEDPIDRTDLWGDPEAMARYDEMVDAMRSAETLHWVSEYRCEYDGRQVAHAEYEIWLAKPNFARIEAKVVGSGNRRGVLIGDGDHFWIHWPTGKPRYGFEYDGKYGAAWEENKDRSYAKKITPLGRHSLGHEVGDLGVGISMTTLDPSTFHGYTDSLQRYIDGARSIGSDTVGDEECDVIEVSIMAGQRSWYLWLSRRDHLPRKLKEIVRVNCDIVVHETWTRIEIGHQMPADLFEWEVPEGWVEWKMPPIEEGLLEPGTPAPDFELSGLDGKKIRLSDFRGKAIWLNKWRCG